MPTRINQATWLETQQRWQIKVQVEGVRKTFTSTTPGRAGKAECHKKADEWLKARLVDENTKAESMYDKWITILEANSTESTAYARQYKSYGENWIKPQFGQKKIGKVCEQDLQTVIDTAHQSGKAAKTLRNIRNCMTAFIKYCRKCKATTLRPESLTIPKGAPVGKRAILQPADVRTLFSSEETSYKDRIIKDRLIHAYRFSVATGIRPGELIALESGNINGAYVTIDGAINYEGEETSGKNENARRKVYVCPTAQAEIKAQQIMLKKEGLISKYVFPAENGEHLDQQAYARAWERYAKHNGLTRITPYEMRHTFVSINKKMPEALLKLQVGHSEDMDTQGTYGHEMEGDLASAATYVEAALGDILKPKKKRK